MPHFERARLTLKELDNEQLEIFRIMVRSGVAVAIPAALDYCVAHRLDAPSWVLEAASDLLCDLLKREKSNRRGRSCGFVARHRQDMVDYECWDQVKVVRQKQAEIREEVEELRKLRNVPRDVLEEREKMLCWVGRTSNRAFECAAMVLEGTDGYGSPEAIKRSYFKVHRNNRDPNQALRYHVLSHRILSRIGIADVTKARPSRIVPFYERTI